MTKLKECPYCGGRARMTHSAALWMHTAYVYCSDCGASTDDFRTTDATCVSKAVEAWNRRVHE